MSSFKHFFKKFAPITALTSIPYSLSLATGVTKSFSTTKSASDEYLSSQDTSNKQEQQSSTIKLAQTTSKISSKQSNKYLAQYIDHTALKPNTTELEIIKLCNEAINNNFYCVCVNPCWISLCSSILKNTNIKVCAVIGFPLGSNTSLIKSLEAAQAVRDGAHEIDMVINIGYIKSNKWDMVLNDIECVVNSVPNNVIVKVILETCLLNKNEIEKACEIAVKAGANFVKTSTGFSTNGAKVEDIELMRKTVDNECEKIGKNKGDVLVKASGGIRDSFKAKDMINAGANRIGASSGVKIIADVEDIDVVKKDVDTY